MEAYKTPRQYGEAEFIEKRSRFIGRCYPVEAESEARARLEELKTRHWDASHNVYAYILRENNAIRYSDDGEPQGTAGLPVLEVYRREEVVNTLCVVTRYFGGILLGAPGLVRAYAHTAKLALDAAGLLTWRLWAKVLAVCPYALFEMLRYEALSCGALVDDVTFAGDVTLELSIPAPERGHLEARLTDCSSGAAELLHTGDEFRGL